MVVHYTGELSPLLLFSIKDYAPTWFLNLSFTLYSLICYRINSLLQLASEVILLVDKLMTMLSLHRKRLNHWFYDRMVMFVCLQLHKIVATFLMCQDLYQMEKCLIHRLSVASHFLSRSAKARLLKVRHVVFFLCLLVITAKWYACMSKPIWYLVIKCSPI